MLEGFAEVWNAELLYAALIAIFSGIIHGYTGFGAALLMVPLFTLIFGPVDAIAIAITLGLFGSVQLYPRAARDARWRELLPVCVAIAIFTPIGIFLLFSLDEEIIKDVIGACVLLAALILLSGWTYKGPRGDAQGAAAGALAGSVTGAAGVGGPALALYFLSAPVPAAEQRANIVISVAAVLVMTLLSLIVTGGLAREILLRAIILIPVYVLGTWSGSRLFVIAPQAYFRRVALWLLVVTGIGIIFV